MADPETRAGILAVAPDLPGSSLPGPAAPVFLPERLGAGRIHTLGRWGGG
jgi:hypothetical protein